MHHGYGMTPTNQSVSTNLTVPSQRCGTSQKNAVQRKASCAQSSGHRTRAISILLQALRILACLMVVGVGLGTTTAGCYDQHGNPTFESLTSTQDEESENGMPPPVGRQDVTMADIGAAAPITTLELASNGGLPKAEDLRNIWAASAKNDDYVRNHPTNGLVNKANRTGDTFTGPVIISPTGATNGLTANAGPGSDQSAINATGNGLGAGIIATGGVSGQGGTIQAGGGNNWGLRAFGAGTEVGMYAIGGGDIAIRSQGAVVFTDTPPAATTDPGADKTQWSQSINSSSALVTSNAFTVNAAGFNVATFAGTALGVATITFARPLPGNNYRIHVMPEDGYDARWNGAQNVGNYQFVVRDMTTNATVDLTTTTITFFVTTVGF